MVMERTDIKNITNNDYDSFRDKFYKVLLQKFNTNPISVNFMECMQANERIHNSLKDIKKDINKVSVIDPPKQILLEMIQEICKF